MNPHDPNAENPPAPTPKEPASDGFPSEKDVSAPPPGTDQSPHPDKKEKDEK
ncbi:MAG: hypothetical protein V4733_00355 [Verrucomicrobiota bacterium]